MAQLPPKLPNFMHQDSHQHQQPQCQDFMHPHHHEGQNPPWVNEFIEFSEAKRGASRGVLSDSSGAFVEAGHESFLDRPLNITDTSKVNNKDEFDKFDDEQFMSLFSNELGMSSSDPSSTSDHNSTNGDKKRKATFREEKMLKGWENVEDGDKAEEVESLHKFDNDQGRVQPPSGGERSDKGGNVATSGSSGSGTKIGSIEQQGQQSTIDPKRVKRILANRQSAQRSRVRKLQYISELERSVTALQSEVSALSPRVAFLDHQRMILTVDNSTLKAKIAALAQDKIFKDAHQEAMKREIERLRQIYYQQNINQTDNTISPSPSLSIPPSIAQPPQLDHTTHENENFNG